IFGPQITYELIGQIEPDEYIAFGFSGSHNSSRMMNADVAVNYLDTHLGYTKDYNISGPFPVNCKAILIDTVSNLIALWTSAPTFLATTKASVPIPKLVALTITK